MFIGNGGKVVLELIYWVVLSAGTWAAFIYFRDLGDITQVVMNVSRENMLKAIRNENRLVATGLAGTGMRSGSTHPFPHLEILKSKTSVTVLRLANSFFSAFT